MKIQNGDIVMISERNKNHLGFGITAYAGLQGKVTNLNITGNFILNCTTIVISQYQIN
jgi:hypothetical protein